MKKILMIIFAGLAALSVGFVVSRSNVAAQSNGLGVTPKESFTMQAGTQASNVLNITNLNRTQTLTVHIQVVDFQAEGENGAAKLFQASDQPQTPWSLKPYISLPDFVSIPAGQSKAVNFTVKLPASVGAGTYYSAVEYIASIGNNNQQQVNVAASTATLLFIDVPGQVSELMTMQSFGLSLTENGGVSSIFHKAPTYFQYRVKNSGNVAEQPAGSLLIKNIFGHIVAHVDNANPKSQLALIGQTRRFTACNPKSTARADLPKDSNCTPFKLAPGFYTATLAVYYGQNGQETRTIGATAHFWYLPWSAVIILVVILLAIAFGLYRLYRRFAHR